MREQRLKLGPHPEGGAQRRVSKDDRKLLACAPLPLMARIAPFPAVICATVAGRTLP